MMIKYQPFPLWVDYCDSPFLSVSLDYSAPEIQIQLHQHQNRKCNLKAHNHFHFYVSSFMEGKQFLSHTWFIVTGWSCIIRGLLHFISVVIPLIFSYWLWYSINIHLTLPLARCNTQYRGLIFTQLLHLHHHPVTMYTYKGNHTYQSTQHSLLFFNYMSTWKCKLHVFTHFIGSSSLSITIREKKNIYLTLVGIMKRAGISPFLQCQKIYIYIYIKLYVIYILHKVVELYTIITTVTVSCHFCSLKLVM